ncbi:hypothetical protein [Anaerobacillus alkalilacustris]|nr:hypothetical protein [Anaerobacillus alkalilacustris]
MENRKRIRKTIRLVLREVKRERLQKENISITRSEIQRKDVNG